MEDDFINSNPSKPRPQRIEINLSSKVTTGESIYCKNQDINSAVSLEFPSINYNKYNGKPYRYIYGVNYIKLPFSIIKMDLEDSSKIYEMKYEHNGNKVIPCEAAFVENPNASEEDDGVLLVICLTTDDSCDFLSILDAKNLKEIARATLPQGIMASLTLHGFFAEANSYKTLN